MIEYCEAFAKRGFNWFPRTLPDASAPLTLQGIVVIVLQTLHIKNLALVVELEIDFGPGLNTVTGETGAGKSLIIGALQLLVGDRAGPGVIRRGAKQSEIAATLRFTPALAALQEKVESVLEENGVPSCEGGDLLLRRVVSPSGSRAFVNGSAVTMHCLRRLGDLLVDMHGPHEHQSLLQPRNQLALLDEYADLTAMADECTSRHLREKQLHETLAKAQAENSSAEDLQLVRYQLNEIEAADPQVDEDRTLTEKYNVASNARQLLELAALCRQALTDADGSITEQLGRLLRSAQEIESTDSERGGSFVERLEEAVNLLQDLSFDLGDYADSLELDQEELLRIEERLNLMQKLKRKYGSTVEEILNAASRLRDLLDSAESRESQLAALTQDCRRCENDYLAQCRKLSTARHQAAAGLATAISAKLRHLGFVQSGLEIKISETTPGPRGMDHAEFCFAPNPGEPLLPLRQIASSGEIARVMLAVKTVLSAADNVPILIFDEVDTNIGGRIAVTVAEELAALGSRHQVLCITHLPQIAAAGQTHFQVTKTVQGDRTVTDVIPLGPAEREREITRMLGASDDSPTARRHAREMLQTVTMEPVT